MNRLKLNFQIESAQDRANFIKSYLADEEFKLKPPTKKELETISNYILWGKDANGEKIDVEIDRKNSTWAKKQLESIEGLRAQEGFQEADLQKLGDAPILKAEKVKFRREEIYGTPLEETFTNLFRRIDELDLLTNFYEFLNGKRTEEPRAELLQRFTDEELQFFKIQAQKLTEGRYLKLRHELVELRREQYTLRDSLKTTIFRHTSSFQFSPISTPSIEVYPFGLIFQDPLSRLVFQNNPAPGNFSNEDLQNLSDLIWRFEEKKDSIPSFLRPEFWNFLLDSYNLLSDAAAEARFDRKILSEAPQLKDTVDFYIQLADLTPIQKRILQLKFKGIRNEDIVREIKRNFGKSYSVNYISTIYRQRIVDAICAAANNHYETVKELFWSENFKTCKSCGRVLLKVPFNFTRKKRGAGGFSTSCKRCEKKKREEAKIKKDEN